MTAQLDHAACYPAVERDDPRFDGQFFTAVLTTGIFCRSICTAQTPRAENVRFFSTAAAAAESGFRPCLRCRPESAPDPPPWQSVSPTVSQALRLIGEGFLNERSVEDLSKRLNVSNRHLQRLFLEQLGTPPVSVAQTRRLLFAKKLIDETNLPMADVAFSAGYSSVRRFNEAIRQTYGRTPTDIRKKRRKALVEAGDATISLRLFYREPYNWPIMLDLLAQRATPFVDQVDGTIYRRMVRTGACTGVIEVEPIKNDHALMLRVPVHLARHLLLISERVKQIFDLAADPIAIDSHLRQEALIGPAVQRHAGLRIPGAWDGFELTVRTLLDRAFGVEQAKLAAGLLVRSLGEQVTSSYGSLPTHSFPEPARVCTATSSEMQLPLEITESIQTVAQRFADGSLVFNGGSDPGVAAESLASIPGIDDRMARYILVRLLALPDIALCEMPDGPIDPETGVHISHRIDTEPWRPWRSYASIYALLARTLPS